MLALGTAVSLTGLRTLSGWEQKGSPGSYALPACLDLPLNLPQSDCEETADANGPRELTALACFKARLKGFLKNFSLFVKYITQTKVGRTTTQS